MAVLITPNVHVNKNNILKLICRNIKPVCSANFFMTTIAINIEPSCRRFNIDRAQLRHTIRQVLKEFNRPAAAVGLVVTDNDAISRLHQQFLGAPEITDVLSFNLTDASGDSPLECDIIVNAERAWELSRQKKELKFAAELNLYIVHGLLHQLGFDDHCARQARLMHRREDGLLIQLNFGPVYRQGRKKVIIPGRPPR